MSDKTSLVITLLDKDGNKIKTDNEHTVIHNNKQLESLNIYKDISRVDISETHYYETIKSEDDIVLGGKWIALDEKYEELKEDQEYQAKLKRAVSHHYKEHQFEKKSQTRGKDKETGKNYLVVNYIEVHTIGLLTAIEKQIFYGLLLIGCKKGTGSDDLEAIGKIGAGEFILKTKKEVITFETSIPELLAASGFSSNNKYNYDLALEAIKRLSKVRIEQLKYRKIKENKKETIEKEGGPTNLIYYSFKEINSKDKNIEIVLSIVNSKIILDPDNTSFSYCPISLQIRNNLKSKTAQLLYDYLLRIITENKKKRRSNKNIKTSEFSSVTLYNMLYADSESFNVLSEIEKINSTEDKKDREKQMKKVYRTFDKIYEALIEIAEIRKWQLLKSKTKKRQDVVYYIKPL
ncbi:MAG: hypothetical protein C0602_08500 [Denitrovibrio sp.]|nr:MAG: hypothetical protein C0602_08500 [Denitrovibrio sp.]